MGIVDKQTTGKKAAVQVITQLCSVFRVQTLYCQGNA